MPSSPRQQLDARPPFSFFPWSWRAKTCMGSKTPSWGRCNGGIQLKTCHYYTILHDISKFCTIYVFTWAACVLVELRMIDNYRRQINLGFSLDRPPPAHFPRFCCPLIKVIKYMGQGLVFQSNPSSRMSLISLAWSVRC
jgi:hypothetical protein